MTSPGSERHEARIISGLAPVLIAAMALRLLVSVVAGFGEISQSQGVFAPAAVHTGEVLLAFGGAGDGVGVLLALAAAGLLWWQTRLGSPAGEWLHTLLQWILGLTGLSAVVEGVGYIVLNTQSSTDWPRLVEATGFSAAVALVAAGALVALRRFDVLVDLTAADGSDEGDGVAGRADALVFAVDRDSGDVRAFFSFDEAARRTHVYSVEDNEFAFFTDEGTDVVASIEHARIVLRPAATNHRADLLDHLQEFVVRREIHIDVLDVDDPSAYAVPVSDWQWLQLWPGWMRGLARLIRRI
jgi:hypothetical protein